MARSPALVSVLLLLLSTAAVAEEVRLPKPILDTEDLSIHVVETSCNSYLITCKQTGEFVVVDPGPRLGGTFTAWRRTGHTAKAIWITHEHGDHTGGVGDLLQRLKLPVVAHAAARDGMKRSDSRAAALPDTIVADGGEQKVGKTTWKVLHLPGHSPGSIGFLLEGRVLVAGDVLFKGSVGRTDFPGCDPEAFATALGTKVWPLADEIVVLPGHGPHTTMGAEKKTNRLFQDLARRGRGEPPIPRPWMGVQLDPDHAGPGIRLVQVVAGSPAAAAGLRVGDVLTAIDGIALAAPADLGAAIRRHAVGDAVPVNWLRGTARMQGTLTLTVRPTGR
jgi:glyoxylase-like metal-dependent hydrolase (beta-lactamase superfamily II)